MEKAKIQFNEYIFGDAPCRGGSAMFVARIVEVREKAVKVDYAIEPVFAGGGGGVTVFTRSAWVPKSVITHDERGSLILKRWFARKGLAVGSHNIKKYFITEKGEKAFV